MPPKRGVLRGHGVGLRRAISEGSIVISLQIEEGVLLQLEEGSEPCHLSLQPLVLALCAVQHLFINDLLMLRARLRVLQFHALRLHFLQRALEQLLLAEQIASLQLQILILIL